MDNPGIDQAPEEIDKSWSNIWWVGDISYIFTVYFEAFYKTEVDCSAKAVDAVMSVITFIYEDCGPDMMFVALDSGLSERAKIYPPYKAGRKSRAATWWGAYDALLRDLEHNCKGAVHTVASVGWEADDVMATIAKSAVEGGRNCVLMTNDKDTRQCLVPNRVTTQRRTRGPLGRPTWGWLTCDQAEQNWGVSKSQFIDYQVLTGDDTDNIPGCDGIGDEWAKTLLLEYGNIDGIRKALDEGKLPKAKAKNLKEFLPKEEMIRKLVELRTDVEFENVFLTKGELPENMKYPIF